MKKSLKVYRQAVLLFVAVVLIIFTTNIFFYWYNLKQINIHKAAQIEESSNFLTSQLTLQVTYLNQYSSDILNRPELKNIECSDPTEEPWIYYKNVNDMIYKLNSSRMIINFINDSFIYIKNKEMVLSANNGIVHVKDSKYEQLIHEVESITRVKLQKVGDKVYLFDFREKYTRTANFDALDAVMCFEIDVSSLINYIKTYLNNENVSVKIKDEDGSVVMNDTTAYSLKNAKLHQVQKPISATGQVLELGFIIRIFGYNFLLLSLIFSICIIFAVLGIGYYVSKMNNLIHKPIKKIIKAFKDVETGSYNVELSGRETEEFAYLYDAIKNIVSRLKLSIETQYEQKLALKHSEIKQFQLQINPHFLYNGFYNIQRMCTNKQYEKVDLLSKRLASYYRYITRNGIYFVPLKEEIKHMEDYIDIQTIRFQDRISVVRNYDADDFEAVHVPRLILQPILENIYEHAFNTADGAGQITIAICEYEEYLHCVIEDNGTGMSEEQLQTLNHQLHSDSGYTECTGILNVNKRLKLHYGQRSGLTYSCGENHKGVRIDLYIYFSEDGGTDLV